MAGPYQIWFGLSFACTYAFLGCAGILSYLIPLPRRTVENWMRALQHYALSALFLFNPQISVELDQSVHDQFKEAAKTAGKRPIFFMTNHISFLDGFLFSLVCPGSLVGNCNTLMDGSFFKIPLLGHFATAAGIFKVAFKGKTVGDFSVDREAQAKVAEDMEEYFDGGGWLAFCPEGQINRVDCAQLQLFRRGSFKMAIENKAHLYGLCFVGANLCWAPSMKPIGGFPAKITCKMTKIFDDYSDDKLDAAKLCDLSQAKMQTLLDSAVKDYGMDKAVLNKTCDRTAEPKKVK